MLTIGLLIGMAVSITPGLGLVMGVVLALPFTYQMGIEPSIILLTAIYIAGTYGGCFTAILYKIPGEPSDVPLLWDGYGMAQKGQAEKALGWALIAALIGGLVSTTVMVSLAGPFANFALKFDSPDFFALIFLGLTTVVSLAGRSMANALISLFLGLLISTVGVDSTFGAERFTFDQPLLAGGIKYITVLVGAYGLGEVFSRFGEQVRIDHAPTAGKKVGTRFPSWRELWDMRGTLSRSTVLGTVLGVVPGAGAVITSFVAYGIEMQYCKRRDLLGTGIPEGIVGPQIASTASVAGHMVPLLALGIPGSGATAVILGAFLLHGVQPGPQIFVTHPDVAYSILASLFAGVIGMCIIGYFWIGVVVKVLTIPQPIIITLVALFCVIGGYTERNDITDVWMIFVFGVVGYLCERYRFPVAPIVLGTILGPVAESAFVRTMLRYDNDWTVFFTRPISGFILALAFVALVFPVIKHVRENSRRAGLRRAAPAIESATHNPGGSGH